MKNELHIMSAYVGLLVMNRPAYCNTDVLKSIKSESERLKEMLLFSFNQGTERFQFTEVLSSYYTQFIHLADTLWERARQHNPIARSALLIVISLIHYTELHYGSFLYKNQALAAFESFKLSNQVSAELLSIKVLLVSKKISEPLIHQLLKAFNDLFKESKHLVFSVADRTYIEAFLPKLSALARDQRDKDWNRRLIQLLIKNNFNHMGLYKLLEAEQEKEVFSVKNHKQQLHLFYEKTLWLEQIQVMPVIAYNPYSKGLKSLLKKHLDILQSHVKEEMVIANTEKHPKLKHNLSIDEMALEFHYKYGEKVYNYRTKRAAAEVFCMHNCSIGTDEASVNSFLNVDKMDRSAALRYYQRNNRIQKKLAEDFDL